MPPVLHSYLLWRSSVQPGAKELASCRYTAAVSLLPAAMVGLFVFGWYAGMLVALAVGAAFLTDFAGHKLSGRWIFNNPSGPSDGTWLLAGLLVGLLLPPAAPWYVPVAGGMLAVAVGKHWLSVDGMPLLQPAAVALLLLHLVFFWAMHPTTEVTYAVTARLAERAPLAAGSVKLAQEPDLDSALRVLERTAEGEVRLAGSLRNLRPHALAHVEVSVQARKEDGSEAGEARQTLGELDKSGGTREFELKLPAAGEAASFTLELAYSETKTVDKWPMLARTIKAPDPGAKGMVRHLAAEFLGGDITRSMDRQQYLDQILRLNGAQAVIPGTDQRAEAYFGPRPLDLVKLHPDRSVADLPGPHHYDGLQQLLGVTPGPIGGSSALALCLGILLLVFTGSATWITPLVALGTLLGGLYYLAPQHIPLHLLSGYSLLGFFYLAADETTVPRSRRGKFLAGLAAGLLELILRCCTPLSEGVFISAICVQGLSLVFDQYVAPPQEARETVGPGVGISPLGRL